MIIVRDIFQLQFGKAREAIALLEQGNKALKQDGYSVDRLLADVTGDYYTLVMESSFESLGDYESALKRTTENEAWKENYGRFVALVHSGRREVFRVVG